MVEVKNVYLPKSNGVLENFKKCLILAPLPVISLLIYMILKSTQIFPDDRPLANLWHPAYLGWYDFMLGISVAICMLNGIVKLDVKDLLFVLSLVTILLLSFTNASQLGDEYIVDSIVCFLRFVSIFYLAKALVIRLGTETAQSILMILFIILAISALFVYRLQLGSFNRIYASAMTVASFSQVSVIVCLIAVKGKYNKMALFSLLFLLLTFSRTSLVLLLFLFAIYSRTLPLKTTIKYYSVMIGVTIVSLFLLLTFGGDIFASVIAERTDTEGLSTLNSRDAIWGHAMMMFDSGYIPLFGIGWNATPYLIVNTNLSFIDKDGVYYPPHFHSIVIEYACGLGISSLFIWFCLIKRIWQTFYHNLYPAFFIFAFFLMSQSGDFTFYRPKELIIWSLMLGLAEGQWRLEHG
ncbi:O-antigen ligase family protein [Microcoleus sp. T3_B1]|uniref:O-antigen ligase family protein n=1 Tax=unclassified Microcoleus TaxID=2642155 RepID=UPI002FCFD793